MQNNQVHINIEAPQLHQSDWFSEFYIWIYIYSCNYYY